MPPTKSQTEIFRWLSDLESRVAVLESQSGCGEGLGVLGDLDDPLATATRVLDLIGERAKSRRAASGTPGCPVPPPLPPYPRE